MSRRWSGSRLVTAAVLQALQRRAQDGEVTVAMHELARELDIGVTAVWRAIGDLIDDEVITRVKVGAGRMRPRSTYVII